MSESDLSSSLVSELGNTNFAPGDPVEDAVNRPLLSWQVFRAKEAKPIQWYVVMGLIFGLLVIGAIWLRSWSLLVLLVVMVAVYAVVLRREPQTTEYALLAQGLRINHLFYPYEELQAFCLQEGGAELVFLVHHKQKWLPDLRMPVVGVEPELVQELLAASLPEEPPCEEDLVDRFTRWLKL